MLRTARTAGLGSLLALPIGLAICAPAAGSVTLAEAGRVLRQIVDSGVPLHASQTLLDTACAFQSDPFIPNNIESIAVHPVTGTLWVQISAGGGGDDTGVDTCVFAVSPAGVVTPVSLSTGLRVSARGADMVFDPTTGLLLTMDETEVESEPEPDVRLESSARVDDYAYGRARTKAEAGVRSAPQPGTVEVHGRIASIDPSDGTVATYSQLSAPGFGPGGTFGMQFSAGIGVVPAGHVVYTTDVEANGIYSTNAGGTNGPAYVTPPEAGDYLVIQPDGDWVHIGDGGGQIIAYSPFAPHAASPSDLSVDVLLDDEGLTPTFGTRASVCSNSGTVYVSQSGEGGGAGIFRIDESLSTATLVVAIEDGEGLHDLVVGPSSQGSGTSVYFTVWDSGQGTQEVWEVTAPECTVIEVPTLSRSWIAALAALLLAAGLAAVVRSRIA
jgi:hypothetical protein